MSGADGVSLSLQRAAHSGVKCKKGETTVEFLFNSKGNHIANFVNGQLHSPSGHNIGHYLENEGIFIDMSGRYLGEIVEGNRLMYQRSSPHKSANFGNYGNYGNVGNYGNPGNCGSIGSMAGYDDIETPWL